MSSTTEPPTEDVPLDEQSRRAMVAAVDDAKARGWSQADLQAYFIRQGVTVADYAQAKAGAVISAKAFSAFATASIIGLPDQPPRSPDDFEDIPAQMKAARRWLLWRSEPGEKKPRKVPYYTSGQARHGALDTPEDTARLDTFAGALKHLQGGGYTGLGFALGQDETGQHWQGIDLDALADHPGLTFVASDLPGYTEKSPSGQGVHAIGYGRRFGSLGSNATGIEAYAEKRYFTVTGTEAGLGELTCLADFVESRLAPLHSPRPQDTSQANQERSGSFAGQLAARDLRSALASMPSDDRDLWIKMGLALKELGDIGRGLWIEWSQTSEKYDAADAGRTWTSFKPDHTGYAAVFAEAQRRGWANPGAGGGASTGGARSEGPKFDPETGEVFETDDDLFEVLSIAQIKALPQTQWLIKDTIPNAGLGFLYGPPGSYKSFVCYDLALTLAYLQDSWIDRPIKTTGSVLYIANEGASGAQKRITAWQQKQGVATDSDAFHLIRKSMSFMNPGDVDKLERTVAAHVATFGPVGVVFVDTVSRVLPGADENLQKDMTIFVAACDRLRERFEATVVGVHHTNKNGDMRGSTVFLGQGDFVFRVDKHDDRRGGVLTCEKQKDAEDGWKVAFGVETSEWIPAGHIEAVTSLTVDWYGEPQADEAENKWPHRDVLHEFQRDIQAAFQAGSPFSMAPQTKNIGRYAPARLGAAHNLRSQVVKDVLETWLNNGVIEVLEASSHSKMRGLQVSKWID